MPILQRLQRLSPGELRGQKADRSSPAGRR